MKTLLTELAMAATIILIAAIYYGIKTWWMKRKRLDK